MSKPLPLPPVGDLSEQQVRGTACVYCGIHLGAGPAVDLGEQLARVADLAVRWFPRACRQHGRNP
ncbi:hypothetical protein [Streptomyces katrae]|uniref:hypothetical protein n=1 Tax=Streptomyces katrae TaxID=68223 RepID=UPI0004C04D05|nr:hypothetical protein [Streptomyces katrae]